LSNPIKIINPIVKSVNFPNGQQLLQQVQTQIQESPTVVVLLDCTEISFVDSAGLAALVRIAKETQRKGIRFCLCGVKNQMATLLRLTAMEGVFETFTNVADFCNTLEPEFPQAIAALRMR
jgi:anti-anti-sigma factor